MAGPLLNVSHDHLFYQGRDPVPLRPIHRPRFLAFPRDPTETIEAATDRLRALQSDAVAGEDDLARIHEVHEPVSYESFWDHKRTRDVIPVAAEHPGAVPAISDRLFFEHGFYTCEHDIPYRERVLADISAENDDWLFDTKGRTSGLKVLTYDIETTQYQAGKKEIPIDIIGYSHFDVKYESSKDLETEEMDFRFVDLPQDWQDRDVQQLVSRNLDEEMDHLMQFTQHAVRYDMIAGHNVLGFDNLQIVNRMQTFLDKDRSAQSMSPGMKSWYEEFLSTWSHKDRSFHFGTSSDIAVFHPSTLDTFHAARKFYFFLDDFTLKGLAPWLGVHVDNRIQMAPDDMGLDPKTLEYNKHDVQEQIGVTQKLIAQALPLAFTVNLPLDELLTGGNTRMWDHMALIRARRQRRFMPATSRAQGVAQSIHRQVRKPFPSREEVAAVAREIPEDERKSSHNREFIRVAKQGPEMPFWCEHPGIIVRTDGREGSGYEIAGGLTLKPDADLKSHFVPWYHVVEADVGAMYPTLLKAKNLTADTVQPARKGEHVDDWIWLKDLDSNFVQSDKYEVRRPNDEEDYTKGKGWMVGMKHRGQDGLVNLAMTGILATIQKVKDKRAEAKRSGADEDTIRVLDMTYASLKAARNAGTHGIMVAVNVSCRQFNVWGGANITTIGQKVLDETRQTFVDKGIRVVYGDTDGIYLGCSKSAGNLPHFAAALGADVEPAEDKWITMPNAAIEAVEIENKRWREWLNYPDFELEAEQYDAMVFIVHKNYLKFKADADGHFKMETKGNNFKGSDKAPLAQKLLSPIMQQAMRDVAEWDDEDDARERMKTAIKRATKDHMAKTDVNKTPWEDLILRQTAKPIRSYKPNPDGSLSTVAVRAAALEQVIGEPLNAGRKFHFIVCKDPLPLYQDVGAQQEAKQRLAQQGYNLQIRKPNKSGIKPIEYMWPVDHVKPHMVDWVWYKDMVEKYVCGAFGFSDLELAVQRGLDSWM